MTTLTTAARLGDSSAQFSRQYGPPHQVRARGMGVLREYTHGLQVVAVLFERDRAIALRVSYGAGASTEQPQPLDVLPAWAQLAGYHRLFVGDQGWLAALPDCPEQTLTWLLRST